MAAAGGLVWEHLPKEPMEAGKDARRIMDMKIPFVAKFRRCGVSLGECWRGAHSGFAEALPARHRTSSRGAGPWQENREQ